jgi:hypothetical protein
MLSPANDTRRLRAITAQRLSFVQYHLAVTAEFSKLSRFCFEYPDVPNQQKGLGVTILIIESVPPAARSKKQKRVISAEAPAFPRW